jgi:quinol monooxygenase YgiN
MLIVIGRAQAEPRRRAELAAAAHIMTTASAADDGCHHYGFYADLADENAVIGIELWRDKEALDAHMTHGHTLSFLAELPVLIIGEPAISTHDIR